jgi:hypothetical protein
MKNGHSEICRLGTIEEIQQKNIIFPEFLRSIRQISVGPRTFCPPKAGCRRQCLLGIDFLPAKRGPPEVTLQLSVQFFQATA